MIVSCGEALIDMVPDPVPGGGPMNVAIAAARLGAPSAFVGALSTDPHGDLLHEHLVANGVDVSHVVRVDAPTARAIVEHDPTMRFRFEGSGTADTLLTEPPELEALGAGIVHGGTLGMFRGATATTLADLAVAHRGAGGTVSLDANIRPQIIDDVDRWTHFHDRWLAQTDLYKGSDEDMEWIWPGRAPESVVEELLAPGTMSAVVVTRGGEGLTVFTRRGEATARPVTDIDVVDTVGAGDTIVGAILTQLHELGRDIADVDLDEWERIAENSVAAAAVTVSRARRRRSSSPRAGLVAVSSGV